MSGNSNSQWACLLHVNKAEKAMEIANAIDDWNKILIRKDNSLDFNPTYLSEHVTRMLMVIKDELVDVAIIGGSLY